MKKEKLILGLCFVALSFFNLKAQKISLTAKGIVYEDRNGNGKKDSSEKGIVNVAVSNGADVVLTNSQGKYELPVGNDNIIFVVKPSGYRFALDECNLPRFYYIYKPNGSPELKYPGVQPTGKLPQSIDFGLAKYDEPESFTSFVFGDSQVYFEKEVQYFIKGIVNEAKTRKGVSFGITLGDLVGDDLSLHPSYKKAVELMKLPWYNVLGNHDMDYDVKSDSLSDENFELNFGPDNYSFNYGKAHFIILDDIYYPNPVTNKGYLGGFRKDQLEFLRNDLKHVSLDQLIVFNIHIPLLDKENRDAFRESDRKQVYDLLQKFPNVLVLSAHTHIQYHNFIGKEDGLDRERPIHEYNVGTTCGDWYSGKLNEDSIPVSTMRDGTPKGYALLNVKGNQYSLDYKVAGKPGDYQVSIYNPKVVPHDGRWITSNIYANFFMGSDNDVLECRVDDGKWVRMTKTDDYDPAYYRYMQDWDFAENVERERRPSDAQKCRHLWISKIPANLPVGTHVIEVRATDMFRRTFTSKSQYEIKDLE